MEREYHFPHTFWLANEVGDTIAFTKLFKMRVVDCAIQNLNEKVNKSSKTLYHRNFKTRLDFERYLSIDLPYLYKIALSNFRCSCHSLNIETGRHQNIDRELRHCNYCLKSNIYSVEDEFHMLLICALYSNLRTEFFLQRWLCRHICNQLFYDIISTKNNNDIFCLSNFIYKVFLLRDTF